MTWRKWKRVLQFTNGPSKRDRAREQRRARRRQRLRDLEALPARERFWERFDVWNYT